MKKLVLIASLLVITMAMTLSNAYAYNYWDEPVLDLDVKSMQTFQKWRDNTIFINSCDAVKKFCHNNYNIPYVSITAKVSMILEDGSLKELETLHSETSKHGYLALVILPDEKYIPRYQYQVDIIGMHESGNDAKTIKFWLFEKQY